MVYLKSPVQQRIELAAGLLAGRGMAEAARLVVSSGPLGLLLFVGGFFVAFPLGNLWLAWRGAPRVTVAERARVYREAAARRSIVWSALAFTAQLVVTIGVVLDVQLGGLPSVPTQAWPLLLMCGVAGLRMALAARRGAQVAPISGSAVARPRWRQLLIPQYAGWLLGTVVAVIIAVRLEAPSSVFVLAAGPVVGLLAPEVVRSIRGTAGASQWGPQLEFGDAVIGGMLLWGIPWGATMSLVLGLSYPRSMSPLIVLLCLGGGAVGGMGFGALMWGVLRMSDWVPRRR